MTERPIRYSGCHWQAFPSESNICALGRVEHLRIGSWPTRKTYDYPEKKTFEVTNTASYFFRSFSDEEEKGFITLIPGHHPGVLVSVLPQPVVGLAEVVENVPAPVKRIRKDQFFSYLKNGPKLASVPKH